MLPIRRQHSAASTFLWRSGHQANLRQSIQVGTPPPSPERHLDAAHMYFYFDQIAISMEYTKYLRRFVVMA